jgi:hypothetical protein
MAILLFVHLTRHPSTASEQLSCISPVPAPPPLSFPKIISGRTDDAVLCVPKIRFSNMVMKAAKDGS